MNCTKSSFSLPLFHFLYFNSNLPSTAKYMVPRQMFLVHCEAIVHFILAVPNSLDREYVLIHTYTRICANKFATAKIEYSFEMGK